jgi:hypothetical protein
MTAPKEKCPCIQEGTDGTREHSGEYVSIRVRGDQSDRFWLSCWNHASCYRDSKDYYIVGE